MYDPSTALRAEWRFILRTELSRFAKTPVATLRDTAAISTAIAAAKVASRAPELQIAALRALFSLATSLIPQKFAIVKQYSHRGSDEA